MYVVDYRFDNICIFLYPFYCPAAAAAAAVFCFVAVASGWSCPYM